MDRIEYDWARMRRAMRPGSNQYMVTMRAKQLDDWSGDFLRRHSNAVVLHLGCGMDTRAFRLHPPETVQWFDVDQLNVIALRRKLYDDRDGYRMIGSSVTDEVWLDEIPTDRATETAQFCSSKSADRVAPPLRAGSSFDAAGV